MGDYANFQVESMSLGIPTITFVRKNIIKKILILVNLDYLFQIYQG